MASANQQIAVLEEVHEVVVYILECMLQGCFGNMKTEFLALKRDLAQMADLHTAYRDAVAGAMASMEADLFNGDRNRAAWDLIQLRHRLRNTVSQLSGERPWHSDVSAIVVGGGQ